MNTQNSFDTLMRDISYFISNNIEARSEPLKLAVFFTNAIIDQVRRLADQYYCQSDKIEFAINVIIGLIKEIDERINKSTVHAITKKQLTFKD